MPDLVIKNLVKSWHAIIVDEGATDASDEDTNANDVHLVWQEGHRTGHKHTNEEEVATHGNNFLKVLLGFRDEI